MTASQADRDLGAMSVEEVDAEIAALEGQIEPLKARLSALTRLRRNRRGAAASAKVRAEQAPDEKVMARREELGGGRGYRPILAQEFDRSDRTISRKAGRPRRQE